MNHLPWKIVTLVGLTIGATLLDAIAPPAIASSPAPVISATAPPSNLTQATIITERRIRQILDAMQAANKQRDAAGIVQFMAPDVVIDMTVQTRMGTQTIRLNRDEYRQYLQQGYDLTKDYRYRVSNLTINVAPNRKAAMAAYRLSEALTLQNQRITGTSQSSLQFAVVQNQILITSLKAASTINF